MRPYADGARLGVVEAHGGDRGQEGVHIPRTDAQAISVLTCLHHLPGLVGMVEARSDLILDNFTQGHSENCHFTVFNRLALEVGF